MVGQTFLSVLAVWTGKVAIRMATKNACPPTAGPSYHSYPLALNRTRTYEMEFYGVCFAFSRALNVADMTA